MVSNSLYLLFFLTDLILSFEEKILLVVAIVFVDVFVNYSNTNFIKALQSNFSNSLIIHAEKTKEITTVKEVWICDLNYHKIW